MLIYVAFNKNKKLNVIEKVGLAKGCSIVSTSRVHCFSISQSSLCWIWFVLPEFFIHHCQYHTCLNVHDLYSLASKSSVLSLRFAVLTVTKEDNLLHETRNIRNRSESLPNVCEQICIEMPSGNGRVETGSSQWTGIMSFNLSFDTMPVPSATPSLGLQSNLPWWSTAVLPSFWCLRC